MRSLKTRFGLTAAVCALGALGFAGQASAAKLYTNASKTTLVSVGSTATGTTGSVDLTAGSLTNHCTSGTLSATVSDNGSSSGTVSANITSASFSGCDNAVTTDTSPAWVLTTSDINGNGRINGVDVAIDFGFFGLHHFTGDLIDELLMSAYTGSHVEYVNSTGSGVNSVIHLLDAQKLTSDVGDGTIDGDFTLNKEWSVGT